MNQNGREDGEVLTERAQSMSKRWMLDFRDTHRELNRLLSDLCSQWHVDQARHPHWERWPIPPECPAERRDMTSCPGWVSEMGGVA